MGRSSTLMAVSTYIINHLLGSILNGADVDISLGSTLVNPAVNN